MAVVKLYLVIELHSFHMNRIKTKPCREGLKSIEIYGKWIKVHDWIEKDFIQV